MHACLYPSSLHSPSPQLCALRGGVWDDSVYALMQHSGGRCLDKEEAEDVLLEGGHDLEMITVSVSHDGTSRSGWREGVGLYLINMHGAALRHFGTLATGFATQCSAPLCCLLVAAQHLGLRLASPWSCSASGACCRPGCNGAISFIRHSVPRR